MEKLNWIDWGGDRRSCCELGGRVVAVGSDGDKIKLTEFILGDTVLEKVVETDLEAKWNSYPWYYSVLPHKGRILLLGKSQDGGAVCCLIDPFTGLEDGAGDISKENVSVEWVEVKIDRFWYGGYSEMTRVGNRIIYYYDNRSPLLELEIDDVGHRLTGRRLEVKVEDGEGARFQPISDHEVIMTGGYPPTNKVPLVDLSAGAIQELPNLPYTGWLMNSILLFNEFLLVVGGNNRRFIREVAIFDIHTRRWTIIKRSGDWWNGNDSPLLSISNGHIYFIRDRDTSHSHRISLTSLTSLIIDPDIRDSFSLAVDMGSLPPTREGILTLLIKRRDQINTRSTSISSIPGRLASISTSIESRKDAINKLIREKEESSRRLLQIRTRLISRMDSILPTHQDMAILPVQSLPYPSPGE